MIEQKKVLRDTDDQAIRLAKTLLRTARHGALAVLDPVSGAPLASRVGVATDLDGSPILLVSMLSAHTKALIADGRCSLLLGEPGKGDPLAHPRISLGCVAEHSEPQSELKERLRRRYLNRNPKATLYAGLGDFHFFRLRVAGASLNGGFGRAYQLTAKDLTSISTEGLEAREQGAIDHMNADHSDAIGLYARHFAKVDGDGWTISGFDSEGFDLIAGDWSARVWFDHILIDSNELRPTLVGMARAARETSI